MKTLKNSVWVTVVLVLCACSAQAGDGDEAKTSQQAQSFDKEITIRVKLNYLLYLPEGYESFEPRVAARPIPSRRGRVGRKH